MRYLVKWSEKNKRGFRIDELSGIFAEGTGINPNEVVLKWLQPLER
jgi:hypothetical protein